MLSFHTQVLVWLYQYTVAWESQYLLPMSCLPTSSWGQVAPWLWLQPFRSVVSRSAACRKSPPGRWGCPQQAESGRWYAGWPSVPLLKGWRWYRWSSWNWFLQATERLLHSVVCCWKVFLRAPQDQIVGLYGSLDFARHVSDNVINEDKE